MNFSFEERLVPSIRVESSSIFNDDLPPSPPRISIREELEGTKTVEAEVKKAVEVEKPVEVELEAEKIMKAETTDGVTKPKTLEVPGITVPSSATTSAPTRYNIEGNLVHVDQGFVVHDEEDSSIFPDETPKDYYYRTYSEKRASNIHAPVWKLKQGNTFSDWKVYRDWLQGIFPPAEIKFQEE
ncbi:hypothetical protein Hanom_Chr05g00413811 [Helianthus anomalus]